MEIHGFPDVNGLFLAVHLRFQDTNKLLSLPVRCESERSPPAPRYDARGRCPGPRVARVKMPLTSHSSLVLQGGLHRSFNGVAQRAGGAPSIQWATKQLDTQAQDALAGAVLMYHALHRGGIR